MQLGEEYERKKQKLKEELRLDYRRYASKVVTASDIYLIIFRIRFILIRVTVEVTLGALG